MDNETTLRMIRLARITSSERNCENNRQHIADLEALASDKTNKIELLLPLVLEGASRLGILDQVTKECRYELEARSVSHVAMAERQLRWLEKIVEEIGRAGLRVILLKGSAFRGTIYPKTQRGAADIDILVSKTDWKKVCEIVEKNASFRSEHPGRAITLIADYELGFLVFDGTGSFVVEIHRGLTNPIIFHIDEESLWQRAIPHPDFEGSAHVLSAEDSLLHLAVHSYKHLGLINHNLLDAHELNASPALNWEFLIERANEWCATGALYFLLKATIQALDSSVPDSFLSEIQPSALGKCVGDTFFQMKNVLRLEPGQLRYRIAQLFGQLWIPDSKRRVIGFQGYYAVLRFLDFADDFLSRCR